jgi:hypothetical protein
VNKERSRLSDDYIDRVSDGINWRHIVLGIGFIALLGLLLFVSSIRSDKAHQSGTLNAAPTVPQGPAPSTPK